MPIMRLKKGTKVEVWNTTKVPSGSWWSAEIVSGNGHTYSVRYDGYPNDSSLTMERVPRKHIRPCPPPFRGLKELKIGETVEVFYNNTWKFAKLLMIFYDDYCSVMLLESSRKFRTHKSHVRRQLSSQNNKWVVIDKVSGEQNGGMMSGAVRQDKYSGHTPHLCEEMQNFAGKNHFPEVLRSGKKRPHDISIPNHICNNDSGRKMRAIEKDVRDQRIATKYQRQHLEKSDSLVPTTRMLGENFMDGHLNNRAVGSFKMEMGRGISSSNKQKYLPRNVEIGAECPSLSSSVGSCSVDSPCTSSQQQHVANSPQELCRHSDHDESNGSERDVSLSRKDLKAQIHHQELNAYRSTLKAFYASGPVSWERESVMTLLRTALNISADENLLELRNLVHSDLVNSSSFLNSRYA